MCNLALLFHVYGTPTLKPLEMLYCRIECKSTMYNLIYVSLPVFWYCCVNRNTKVPECCWWSPWYQTGQQSLPPPSNLPNPDHAPALQSACDDVVMDPTCSCTLLWCHVVYYGMSFLHGSVPFWWDFHPINSCLCWTLLSYANHGCPAIWRKMVWNTHSK